MKASSLAGFIARNGLLLIIALAFAIRISFFVSLQPWTDEVVKKQIVVKDARTYHKLALSLVNNKSFVDFNGFRNPGYPLFLAIIYSFTSSRVWVALLFQVILSLVSVIMIYKISESIFSTKIALLSSFFFAIDIHQIIYSLSLLTDTLFVLILLISVYFLAKSIRSVSIISIIISAAILGVATLVRPVSNLLPVIIIFFIILAANFTLKRKLFFSLIFIATFVTTLSPWLVHNYTKFGKVGLSSQVGSNLLFCNVAATEAYKTGQSIEKVEKELVDISIKQGAETKDYETFKNSDIYFRIAKTYIRENFILYCTRHVMGIVNMYAGLETKHITSMLGINSNPLTYEQEKGPNIVMRIVDFFLKKTVNEIAIAFFVGFYLIISYLFALYSSIILIKRNEKFVYLFILIILYLSAITGVIGCVRLKLPIMPFINILCAAGLFHFYERWIKKTNLR